MAKQINKLTALGVEKRRKPGYHADGAGLYLQVSGSGSKSWVFRYTRQKKAREMGLGSLKGISLDEARAKRDAAHKQLAAGIDPIEQRQALMRQQAVEQARGLTFDECAERYIKAHKAGWRNSKHAGQWTATLDAYASPIFGSLPVQAIDTALVMKALEPIWRVKPETASRLRGRLESVLAWATVRGHRSGDNPARWRGHLDQLLPARADISQVEHHAALAYAEIGAFMVDLRKQEGMGARALEFAILTAARSGEVRGATWSEIDLTEKLWVIAASRMKAKKEHRVPLSDEAVSLLNALPRVAGTDLIFSSSKGTALSDMTLTAVLKRMGLKVTAHGFRSSFRDWAGETTAFPREVIEHALAHQLKDKAEAAYARGTLLDKRRMLMQAWARYCGTLPVTATVTAINHKSVA